MLWLWKVIDFLESENSVKCFKNYMEIFICYLISMGNMIDLLNRFVNSKFNFFLLSILFLSTFLCLRYSIELANKIISIVWIEHFQFSISGRMDIGVGIDQ